MRHAPFLEQAQRAFKAGQRRQAHHLLQQAVRHDPHNHLAWLGLARTSSSPRASLNFVEQAENLQPDDPLVRKVRTWAEHQVQSPGGANGVVKMPAPPPDDPPLVGRNWHKTVIWSLVTILVIILLFLAGVLVIYGLGQRSEPDTTGPPSIVATPVGELPVANDQDSRLVENVSLSVASSSATPVPTVPAVLAKQIAANGNDPRPTWTTTPSPTSTPLPTPSPFPTFVSTSWQKPVGRPLGVSLAERWVDVDLSEQTLYAYEGNTLIFETLISSGLPDYPTVTGQFRIWYLTASQTMDGRRLGYDYYLEDVPFVMYFFEDYALHGTYWHNNFGTPMSHGCVNMRIEDAKWVFSWAELGTVVNVHQ